MLRNGTGMLRWLLTRSLRRVRSFYNELTGRRRLIPRNLPVPSIPKGTLMADSSKPGGVIRDSQGKTINDPQTDSAGTVAAKESARSNAEANAAAARGTSHSADLSGSEASPSDAARASGPLASSTPTPNVSTPAAARASDSAPVGTIPAAQPTRTASGEAVQPGPRPGDDQSGDRADAGTKENPIANPADTSGESTPSKFTSPPSGGGGEPGGTAAPPRGFVALSDPALTNDQKESTITDDLDKVINRLQVVQSSPDHGTPELQQNLTKLQEVSRALKDRAAAATGVIHR